MRILNFASTVSCSDPMISPNCSLSLIYPLTIGLKCLLGSLHKEPHGSQAGNKACCKEQMKKETDIIQFLMLSEPQLAENKCAIGWPSVRA